MFKGWTIGTWYWLLLLLTLVLSLTRILIVYLVEKVYSSLSYYGFTHALWDRELFNFGNLFFGLIHIGFDGHSK